MYLHFQEFIESLWNAFWRCALYRCGNIRLKVMFLFRNFHRHFREKLKANWTCFVQRRRDKWCPISTSCICSEHLVGDNYHNKMQYDNENWWRNIFWRKTCLVLLTFGVDTPGCCLVGTANWKKTPHPTVYTANVNMNTPTSYNKFHSNCANFIYCANSHDY